MSPAEEETEAQREDRALRVSAQMGWLLLGTIGWGTHLGLCHLSTHCHPPVPLISPCWHCGPHLPDGELQEGRGRAWFSMAPARSWEWRMV